MFVSGPHDLQIIPIILSVIFPYSVYVVSEIVCTNHVPMVAQICFMCLSD